MSSGVFGGMKSWSPEPTKASGPACNAEQPKFPFKKCNLRKGHEGHDHCCENLAGTQIVRVWWTDDTL